MRHVLELLAGLVVIFAFLALGEFASRVVPLGLPGSVAGMVLLALACAVRGFPVARVRPAARLLTVSMGLFILPSGIGALRYADLLQRELVPIVVASAVSTVVVAVTVGLLQQQLDRRGP